MFMVYVIHTVHFLIFSYMSDDVVCTTSYFTRSGQEHLDHIHQVWCLYKCSRQNINSCEVALEEAHYLTAVVSQFGEFLIVKFM